MVGLYLYSGFIAATAIERLIEVRVSLRNAKWSFERGGIEYGKGHYPFMVILHTGFLFACVLEAWLLHRTFMPMLGYPMLIIAILCQALRWWIIQTLGEQWNTRVIIVPNLPRVTKGPYRWFSHPNYIVVALEGVALPLIYNAYFTAIGFTLLNLLLMLVRIRCENQALESLSQAPQES
ncbi:MAG: isoprenylcysteine carboxyl methyltransferase family protein [Myxococcota bacterium]|nr:isoprenylcysteine carboxyl methyltransferase family protein [Myxococcota bacterium]